MNKPGYFGQWGGAYIPEVLYETFRELREVYAKAKAGYHPMTQQAVESVLASAKTAHK